MRRDGDQFGQKKDRTGIFWIVVGAVLVVCPFVNRYDTYDTELLISGITCCLIGAAWLVAREFMRYHSHHVWGVCVILAGACCYAHGGVILIAGLDGLFLIVMGVLILLWPST